MIFNTLMIVAGMLLVVSYIPQLVQIVQTKTVRDLNLKTFGTMTFAIGLMEVYGIHLVLTAHVGQAFLISNSLSLGMALFLCIMIVVYRRKGEVDAD